MIIEDCVISNFKTVHICKGMDIETYYYLGFTCFLTLGMCVCPCMGMWTSVPVDPLEMELPEVVSGKIVTRSSGRTVNTLNHRSVSPVPTGLFIFVNIVLILGFALFPVPPYPT